MLLPALRRSAETLGDARIVMVGSVAGRISGPILGAYAAAKHGLVGLTGSLRAELAPSGIAVLLVEPGAIATPIWDRGQATGDELRGDRPEVRERYGRQLDAAATMAARGSARGLPPAAPARVIADLLTDARPKPRRTVGRDGLVVAGLTRLLPFRAVYRMTRGQA